MQISGIVISKELNKQVKGKNGYYTAWQITYKDDKDEIKNLTKPIQSLSIWKENIESLEVGEKFNFVIEKENDLWELKQINKGDAPTPAEPKKYGGGFNKTPNRDYETKEERALRQRLIVRQSSITSAIEYGAQVKAIKSVEDLLSMAENIENWVWRDIK